MMRPAALPPLNTEKRIDPLRAEFAIALYPRFLDFMEKNQKSRDNLPAYNLRSAAEDAVNAADYLLRALRNDQMVILYRERLAPDRLSRVKVRAATQDEIDRGVSHRLADLKPWAKVAFEKSQGRLS